MRDSLWIVVVLTIAFACGNFVWQALGGRDWGVALERSYFQAFALVVLMVVANLRQKMLEDWARPKEGKKRYDPYDDAP